MVNFKIINCIKITFICNILLSSCGLCPKSIANSQQNNKKNETNIENLTNGSYLFCSDRHPNEDKMDAHRYCFTFTKTDAKVIGTYSYNAPKDTPFICIEGTLKDNLVTGIGYELIFGSPKPLTEKDFAYLKNPQLNEELSYWDNTHVYQGGMNLKVGSPNLHSLLPPSNNEFTTYWAVIRYDIAQLDLIDFELIKTFQGANFEECSEKNK